MVCLSTRRPAHFEDIGSCTGGQRRQGGADTAAVASKGVGDRAASANGWQKGPC
jgi:hypothetical protein